MSRAKRILFIQYANPAAYPPLQHIARILARDGWRVLVLGVQSQGMQSLEWPPTDGVEFQLLGGTPKGFLLKLQYVAYALWAVAWTIRWKPAIVYASDPLITPVALVLRRLSGCWLLYHEHDSPGAPHDASSRMIAQYRASVARAALMCVLPNADRAAAFARETGTPPVNIACVWNCPSRDEVREFPRAPRPEFVVYFHGSINEARLPLAVVDALAALPDHVRLEFAGYETLGSRGYVERFMQYSAHLGLDPARIVFLGAAGRSQVLEWASRCDAGLALMPQNSDDINMRFMVGASNKPFDYLAVGLALVVSRLEEWEDTFVKPGYAVSCDSADGRSIAAALAHLVGDPPRRRAMARAGLARIRDEWNYETQFRPVVELLDARAMADT